MPMNSYVLTRRGFVQSAARLASGSILSSRILPAQNGGRKIGYAIVGLGRISMQHFMPEVKTSEHCRIAGLVSGHRDKAEKMAAEYGVPAKSIYDYQNMEAIADNKEIDAVYIALP